MQLQYMYNHHYYMHSMSIIETLFVIEAVYMIEWNHKFNHGSAQYCSYGDQIVL